MNENSINEQRDGSGLEDLSLSVSDLQNLVAATEVAAIFLDEDLLIKRFTSRGREIFNLTIADIGRPLSEITDRLADERIVADAKKVLEESTPREREIRLPEEKWFLARLAPYRTPDDRIAGVVATSFDITERKRAQIELQALSDRMENQGQRFNTIMASVPDFVYQFDLAGRFTYISQSLLDLWRKTSDEAVGRNFHELDYTQELASKLQRQIDEVIKTRRPLKDETPYTSASGARMYEYLFFPLLSESGKVEGVGGVTRDITDRKTAEEALRQSEERFRTVADNVPQVIWTNDENGVANYFNRRWYHYSGLTYENSEGLGWEAIVHPEDAPVSLERWQKAHAAGEIFKTEYRLRRADGVYRWHLGANVPLRNGDGHVMGWFGSATDIEEVKLAQAGQRTSEERFRVLVEGARDYAMFLLDPDSIITFWSRGAERVFGWKQDEAVGQPGALIFVPEDRAKGAVEQEISTALAEGRAPDRRFHLRKDGSRFWADGVLMRLDEEDGKLRGFAKVARDASDQHEIEDALRHARDEMEQRVVERTRDLLTTNKELEQTIAQRQQLEKELLEISEREKRRIGEDLHDMVCQELTATALFLKSSATKLAKESPSAAETLEESAQIVNRNVGLTRDLARGLQPADLKGAGLKHALRALAEQAAESSEIKCHFKAARGTRVTDDTIALHLYRVAQEAVTNAIKHSEAKNVLITLDHNSDNVCVSVQDDGKGFSLKRRSKGMGLHIMRYRARALGGELKIEKRKRGGMDITCVIPTKTPNKK